MARRTIRKAAVTLALVASIGLGTLSAATTAQATAPASEQINHVWLDLGYEPSGQETIQYSAFLASLREAVAAAGPQPFGPSSIADYRGGREGLVQVSLSAHDDAGRRRGVDLWVRPSNLYIVGYSPQGSNRSYIFSDADFWQATLARRTSIESLPFPGDYTRISQNYNADRTRSDMPISWEDIRRSIIQLADQTDARSNSRNTARSLMLMIQMVSEAARLNDIEGTFRRALQTHDVQHGLPGWQQDLENDWSALSNLYLNLQSGSPARNVTIRDIGVISTQEQVRRYVRLLSQFSGKGNTGHEEL